MLATLGADTVLGMSTVPSDRRARHRDARRRRLLYHELRVGHDTPSPAVARRVLQTTLDVMPIQARSSSDSRPVL